MSRECPNCREGVSFWRAFRTTAWGSFPCSFCGSILGISFGRRMVIILIWAGLLILAMKGLGLSTYGQLFSYAYMGVSLLVLFHFLDKVVLLERRAFTCKECGYDLHGLPEPRCPECGTTFDPEERQRIQDRIDAPPPPAKHRWIAPVVIVLLAMGLVAGMVVHRRAVMARAKRAATSTTSTTPAALPGAATTQSIEDRE